MDIFPSLLNTFCPKSKGASIELDIETETFLRTYGPICKFLNKNLSLLAVLPSANLYVLPSSQSSGLIVPVLNNVIATSGVILTSEAPESKIKLRVRELLSFVKTSKTPLPSPYN